MSSELLYVMICTLQIKEVGFNVTDARSGFMLNVLKLTTSILRILRMLSISALIARKDWVFPRAYEHLVHNEHFV